MATPPTGEQLALFEASYRPRRPLCGPSKSGPYRRRERASALSESPYIEVNPLCIQSLIVTDVDAGDVAGLPQLATKKITRPDALRNAVRLGVGETHKRKRKSVRDFRLLCLLSTKSR